MSNPLNAPPEAMNAAEEAYVEALYALAQRIAAGDPVLMQLAAKIVKYPSDQVAHRAYWNRKADLVNKYTEAQFGRH